MTARILVLGAGFAGLWAAIGAARELVELGIARGDVEIMVVDRNPYHGIRVRNYEPDLADVAIPLAEVLDPIGVRHVAAEVETIDPVGQRVIIAAGHGRETLAYDRLVLALGSQLVRPPVPGLAAHAFDVDTYAAGVRLNAHIAALGERPTSPGRSTAVVIGAGFTGIEVATEMPEKLRHALGNGAVRVILVDHNPVVGATLGVHPRPAIMDALTSLGIETRLGVKVTAIDENAIALSSGEIIPAQTVVWCGGMRASPLVAALPGTHDALGRLAVDDFMQVKGLANIFAAGDAAWSMPDGVHPTIMSCQFGRPMGRFAGHNVVADMFGKPMLPLRIDWYVTVLDLGPWGALYTQGWDRRPCLTGPQAKEIKQTINEKRIYPPRNGSAQDILAAAAPVLQAPPQFPATAPQHQSVAATA
jgi:NADH:quinone reductase (non-electrogenic)